MLQSVWQNVQKSWEFVQSSIKRTQGLSEKIFQDLTCYLQKNGIATCVVKFSRVAQAIINTVQETIKIL